jgi:F-type H+-transporting ATPase subunit a
MRLSPDEIVFGELGFVKLNATLIFTWLIMIVLVVGARLITRNLTTGLHRSRWQHALELIVSMLVRQLEEIGLHPASRYIAFLGTLFIFLASATLLTIVPFYEPPSSSLSTTVALACSVFVAVPVYGIIGQGVRGYLRTYIEPTVLMLPFHVIGEIFRTLALAVRLFGNMMSGVMIVAILLSITPFIFPTIMIALGLLTGAVQSYIFSILAAVYIAAAAQSHFTSQSEK